MYTVLFFPLVFLSALSIAYFSVLPTKIAEAGTKGEVSYLDAPDACVNCCNRRRAFTHVGFFADEEYFLCTSLYFDCL